MRWLGFDPARTLRVSMVFSMLPHNISQPPCTGQLCHPTMCVASKAFADLHYKGAMVRSHEMPVQCPQRLRTPLRPLGRVVSIPSHSYVPNQKAFEDVGSAGRRGATARDQRG